MERISSSGRMSTFEKKLSYKEVCPDCSGIAIVHDEESGEIICGNCGLVLSESTLNRGAEWRAFSHNEKNSRSRVGMPFSYSIHDKGLTTMISKIDRDAAGKKIPFKTKLQMLRLKKWQTRSRIHSSIDKNLAQAMSELDRLRDKLHLPSQIKEEAALIYRRALNNGLVRGRSISAIVAASVYVACRRTKTQRTLREIARYSPINKKDISRCYRLLLKELRLQMPVPVPELKVPKIAAIAGISQKTQQAAVEILRQAERLKTTAGKDPSGLAAAALYIACRRNEEKLTQKKLADAAGITEVTIRNRYKGLKQELNLKI
jgi:transcription initiation factor TFIIB